MKKKLLALVMCAAVAVMFSVVPQTSEDAIAADNVENRNIKNSIVKKNKELRGLWLAFYDYKSVGLYNKSKSTFTKNADKVMKKAKATKCNAIFLHVRAFDDAIWKSKTFKASSDIIKNNSNKVANKAYKYDRLSILCAKAKKYGLEVHAWMNPYRITYTKFYNPAFKSSRDRVLKAINEISKYDVDGIHFDDYFYHSKGRYVKNKGDYGKRLSVSSKTKRKNVNKLVKEAYKLCHKKGMIFGISPQGNYENDMRDGADVKTWLSKTGYVDYVCPQIYWTDNWGSRGKTKMFTQRLNKFANLNKQPKKIKLYVGLALYRTGYSQSDDKGWGWRNTNLKTQLKKLRGSKYEKKGVRGYILFETESLYKSRCQKEIKNFKSAI